MKEFLKKHFSFPFILLHIFLIFWFFFVLFAFHDVSHASSEQTYFPMAQNGNDRWTSGLISQLETQVNATQNYYIAKLWWNQNAARSQVSVIYWSKDSDLTFDGRISSNGYEWSIYKHGSGTYYYSGWWHSWQDPTINGRYNNTNTGMDNVSGLSSVYDNRNSYISNINVMNAESPRNAILWFEIPTFVPDGANPIAPDMSGLDLDSSLNTSQVPNTPTYSNNFNDPIPSWDSTAPVQSLFDIVKWGFDRAYSLLNSFIEYFLSWLIYFINIFTYLIQKIIDAIKFIVNWLYSQFLNWLTPYLNIVKFIAHLLFDEDNQVGVLSLLGAIKDSLNNLFSNSFFSNFWTNFTNYFDSSLQYFSKVTLFFLHLYNMGIDSNNEFSLLVLFRNLFSYLFIPSASDLSNLLVSHDIYGLIDFAEEIQSYINYIKSLLNPTRSTSYKFTIPDVYIMGVNCGSFDIDFSWYLTYKYIGDPIISAFLIFGWFLWIHARLPYWLRGQQGDVIGFAREVQK